MTQAIQLAYYTQARNPSDEQTLLALADELGLDSTAFAAALASETVQQQLLTEIAHARQLHATGFPSLVLDTGGSLWPIAIDYNDCTPMLELINSLR